ncbi:MULTISPECIES: DUF5132 domain-containing protein [Streptomyces]|uniref:DUF5132 domain-containing protein n=2 Tax=Streptomyces TaxID=1883 RepID=A0ABV9IHQ8_9ACTN
MPPVVPPFLIGLIAAPLAKRVVKPLMRGLVKTSVSLVLEVKRAAHEAGEGLQDLAAEVTAEVVAAQMASGGGNAEPASATDGAKPAASDGQPKTAPKGRTPAVATGKAN